VTVIWKTVLQAMILSKILIDYVSCSRTFTAWRSRLVEQELLTLPEHMSSLLVFTGVYIVRSFVVYVEFCKSLFALFVLGHCIACPPSNYHFSLHLCYLQNVLGMLMEGIDNSCFCIGWNLLFWQVKLTPIIDDKSTSPILYMIFFPSKHFIFQNMYWIHTCSCSGKWLPDATNLNTWGSYANKISNLK
jgi:hypothetical protein